MKKMRLFCIGLLTLFSLPVPAQRLLTLEEAIATALQNNYDIKLSRNDSAVAALDYSYRNAVFLPRLNATASPTWNKNNQRQTLADGTKREQNNIKSNNINAALNLNWTIFDGLKMFATREKAEEFIRLGELGIKNQVTNTVAQVIIIYYDIVRQKQQLKATEEQMALSQERVRLAQYKLDIGVGAKPDLLQSKVDNNAQKALQLQQNAIIAQRKEELNQAMNINDPEPYEVSDSIPLSLQMSLSDIQQGLLNNNPALLIAKKNIDIAGLTLRERKAELWPTVSFNSIYNFTRTNNQTVINPFSPLFNQSKGLNFGVSASIPILNGFNGRRLVKQAKLDIEYQTLFYENQRSQLDLAAVNAFIDYERQKRALALEEENIMLARENVNIVMEVYRLNSITLIQLKEAEQSLYDAQTRLITARYNTKLAETELMRLRGDIVR